LFAQQYGSFKDPRDGKVYKTVKIGQQVWMVENFNEIKFLNGDYIPEAKTKEDFDLAIENQKPAWCFYNFDKNQSANGRLYNWYALNDPRKLAPKGWHIPSKKEFMSLLAFLGGTNKATSKLKSLSGWDQNRNGNNSSGFSAQPAGILSDYGFGGFGKTGSWWSRTPTNDGIDAYFNLAIPSEGFCYIQPSVSWIFMSVRFIKD
jgi:uncharacterized protein (TIGR02145 family)